MFDFGLKEKNSTCPGFNAKAGAGFTLVELLVVITIIGILASIVLVSLSNARTKARDVAIQSSLREVRNAAELYYDTAKTYVGVCDLGDNTLANTGDFGRIEDFIIQQGGVNTCQDEEKAYAVISTLNLGDCWCVDSEGNSKKIELTGAETCAGKLINTACP